MYYRDIESMSATLPHIVKGKREPSLLEQHTANLKAAAASRLAVVASKKKLKKGNKQ